MSIRKVGKQLSIPYSNVRNWKRVADELNAFKGNKKAKNLPGAGRPRILPEPDALLAFMDERRHQERALTCTHLIQFLKRNQQAWNRDYISRQKHGCGYDHLIRLLQDFCGYHGYTHQQACKSKKVLTDLESTRTQFAKVFYEDHGDTPDNCVFNVDETAIHFDMPPRYIWSRRGESSKLSTGEKHSYRMTAVLTIRRDGVKLPILFVIRGQPGGKIDTDEIPKYPHGHFYTMHAKAWMDKGVWQQYLWFVLGENIQGKSVLVLDNFKSHVSKEGIKTAESIGCVVCPLPANATSHCQPLDVSIMAPFKRHLRNLWIEEDILDEENWLSPNAQAKRTIIINRAIKAWEMITPEQVRGSFLKALPKQ
ncbi:Aste57867_14436 [Aphanomyces stellatus]|uniref:Aste57867_14436 protein n=1 Tax=Aphanomyces stellatus TaxID=120398 RepID=A0A485L1H0_9STRA|nr:hypothetical protein As57867_014382 [Aphanomyces stellatus]VFT91258.1 Aste57867_14436 [Aphanomyces stellatus]